MIDKESPTSEVQRPTSSVQRPTGFTVIAVLLALTALFTMVFWIVFFADMAAQADSFLARQCPGWYVWERSFPLADAWMAAAALVGALGLMRMRSWGLLFCELAGSALVFLGLMDVLFFVQNGLYLHFNADVAVEAFIHAWVTGFGVFVIAYVWRRRDLLVTT